MNPPAQDPSTEPPPPWRDIDWTKHEKTVRVSGLDINYIDYGTGDPVLLVHGLGGSWQTWLENIPALGANHRVIAVDLPGFGGSEALPDDGDVADHVEVLTDLLDRLRIADAIVVGHSLGGLVTLCTAMWKSDRVRGLVLVSGGGVQLHPVRLALILTAFRVLNMAFSLAGVAATVARRSPLRRILLWPALGDWRSMSAELAAIQIPLMNAPGLVATARAAAAALPGVRTDLITAPMLMIWGSRDRILPVATARAMAAEISHARLVVLDEVGHCAMFEAPAVVNDLVIEFLVANPTPSRTRAVEPTGAPTPIDAKKANDDQQFG